MSLKILFIALSSIALLSACGTSKIKERKEQRAKLAQSSKFYCEFIDGGVYPDVDVALNLEMAKRCDSDKPMTMTQFKSPSDSNGVIYCCSMASAKPVAPLAVFDKNKKSPLDKNEDKKDDKAAPAKDNKDAEVE